MAEFNITQMLAGLSISAITPISVAATGTVTGSNLSGTNTGNQTITLTGPVTGTGTGSFATTITANGVTRANLAATGAAAILGATAAGNVADLTGTQATTLLDAFTSALKGVAPASGGGTANFLRADGTWTTPAGGGGYVVTTKTAGYTETATTGEQLALCSLAGGFTVILPAASGNVAKLGFKKMLAAGQITISRAGTDLIDGATTAVLNNQYEAITIMSDGTANWEIV